MQRKINKHIIHCSDSTFGDVETIRRWHKERGWIDIGYHFVIKRDGTVEVGRDISAMGAHCLGQNRNSIGTCLIGKKSFNKKQFDALKNLHTLLKVFYPEVTVHGHREFSNYKTCPNFDVKEIMG